MVHNKTKVRMHARIRRRSSEIEPGRYEIVGLREEGMEQAVLASICNAWA
jgi:hypothetical protein